MAGFTLKSVFEAVDKITGPVRTMSGNASKSMAALTKGFTPVNKAVSAVGGAIRALLPALSVAAASKAITAFATRGDDIARNASILGLTATAYQELSYAARMADVDQEAFAAASKKLSKNLGDLKLKTGSLYLTLSKSNPALARQLKNAKDNDAAFTLMAAALDAETDVQKRAALAQAAFGKTGQDLIPMMRGLADARKAARDAGAVMSDDEVKAAEGLEDSLKRIKAAGMGVVNSALSKVAEAIAPIIERVSAWTNANRELIGQRIESVFNAVGSALVFIKGAWDSGLIPAILAGVVAFKTITLAVTAFNAVQSVMAALAMTNPLGWIGAAVAGLAALITLVVTNWDKITGFFDRLRGGVQSRALSGTGAMSESPGARGYDSYGTAPQSAQSGLASAYSESVSRSMVDVNFNNAPAGTAIKQRGRAPGVLLSLGPSAGGAR